MLTPYTTCHMSCMFGLCLCVSPGEGVDSFLLLTHTDESRSIVLCWNVPRTSINYLPKRIRAQAYMLALCLSTDRTKHAAYTSISGESMVCCFLQLH